MSRVLLAVLAAALVFTPLDMAGSKRIVQAQGSPRLGGGGRILWQDFLDLGGSDRARRVALHKTTAFVVGEGGAPGNTDWLVRAYDIGSGQLLWMDRFDGGHLAIAFEVAADNLAVYVAGAAAHSGSNCFLTTVIFSNCDFVVRAYSHTGNLLWHHQSDMNGLDDFFFSIDVDGGRVVASGGTINPSGNEDLVARAFDAVTGGVLWTRVLDGGSDDEAEDVDIDGSQVFVAGAVTHPGGTCTLFTEPFYSGNCDYTVIALDATTGITQWINQFDFGFDFDFAGEVVVQGQRIFVTGMGTPPGSHCEADFGGTGGNCDILTRSYDRSTGLALWTNQFGEPGAFDQAFHIAADGTRVYVSGLTAHPGPPGATCFKPFSTFPPQQENCDFLVLALNATLGGVVWQDRLDVAGGLDAGGDIKVEGRQVVAVGRVQTNLAVDALRGQDAIVRAYESGTGRLQWDRRFDRASHHDRWRGVAIGGASVIAVGESFGQTRDFGVMAFSR